MGPDALRHPPVRLPADPQDDDGMPAELQALKRKPSGAARVGRRPASGLVASSLYDAGAWFSTGLGDHHSHDAQIGFIPVSATTTTSGTRA